MAWVVLGVTASTHGTKCGGACGPICCGLGQGGTHQNRSIPKYNRRDAKEWRILVSSESITGGSSLHSGILLCQKLTTPQVSTNIDARRWWRRQEAFVMVN